MKIIDSNIKKRKIATPKKYTIDLLIKQRCFHESQKPGEVINELARTINMSIRAVYYLKDAKVGQDAGHFTMTDWQRKIIADFFEVLPKELDNQ